MTTHWSSTIIPYRDRHLILAVLTRSTGVQRGVLRRARGGKTPRPPRHRCCRTSTSPSSTDLKPNSQISVSSSSSRVPFRWPATLRPRLPGSVVAELLATFCPLGEPAEKSFRLGVAALEALLSAKPARSLSRTCNTGPSPSEGCSPIRRASPTISVRQDAAFLASCRRQGLADVAGPVPAGAARWLDQRVREEAERPLRALSFFRSMME